MTHASPAPKPGTPPDLIDTADQLGRLAEALAAGGDAVAVDTEANSFHRYFERMCLLQLSAGGTVHLVDPLAAIDLAPLLALLATRRLLLHGADYDLRLLHRGWGFRAREVFDTMLAAQLLGEKEIGLAALLARRVGVTRLDKAHQRADWTERPLPRELLTYAAADVSHLHALAASLEADLVAKGRLAWHEEECRRLAELELVGREADPENDWRIKGSNGLTNRERAFLRALWEAREERARELDRPVFRVAHNERLLAAAKLASAGEGDPEKLLGGQRPLPPVFARRIQRAVADARSLPPASWPSPRRGEHVEANPALEHAIERLKKRRDAAAVALGLDPGVVASRATMASAAGAMLKGVQGASQIATEAGISRWRAEILAG